MKILFIEDDLSFVEILQRLFKKLGFNAEIDHYGSLESASEQLKQTSRSSVYDVILLDLSLPGVEGLSGLKLIKSFSSALPVVIFSGNDNQELAEEALVLGAQDYLIKPALVDQNIATTVMRAIGFAIKRQQLLLRIERDQDVAGRLESHTTDLALLELRRAELRGVHESLNELSKLLLGGIEPGFIDRVRRAEEAITEVAKSVERIESLLQKRKRFTSIEVKRWIKIVTSVLTGLSAAWAAFKTWTGHFLHPP